MSKKLIIVDPPSGWKYGFPKPLVYNTPDETVEQFCLRNGYPQKLIDDGMLKYCRTWEEEKE